MSKPVTYVYVDGFNLYYRRLKGNCCNWLNIPALCDTLLPRNDIQAVKYYTASVSARPHDPDKPIRQQVFLRALRTDPRVSITYGLFSTHPARMLIHGCNPHDPQFIVVSRTNEKGSDVNLASHLLHDAHRRLLQVAVVVSADSDLAEPIRIVREELQIPVIILSTCKHLPKELQRAATYHKAIRLNAVRAHLYPYEMHDARGSFSCPERWREPGWNRCSDGGCI